MPLRALSDDILTDPRYNALSDGAVWIFNRLLVKSDDFGVLPFNIEELHGLLNTYARPKYHKQLEALIREVVDRGFAKIVDYNGGQFFIWKPETFKRIQGAYVSKRTKSKYLRIKRVVFEADIEPLWASRKLQEITVDSRPSGDGYIRDKSIGVKSVEDKSIEGEAGIIQETDPDPPESEQPEGERPNRFNVEPDRPPNAGTVELFFVGMKMNNPKGLAATFMDHYDANGWTQPGGQVIRNWQAQARKWVRDQPERERKILKASQIQGNPPASLPPVATRVA
jgi:hypothetical protein